MMQEEYFSVISKAQTDDGSYQRVTDMSSAERRRHREDLNYVKVRRKPDADAWGIRYTRFNQSHRPIPALGTRDVHRVYNDAAVHTGLARAREEELRPSSKHKNVHYGSSITPEMEAKIDAALKPEVLRANRGGVAYHHGLIHHGMTAGAASSHVTTGGKGRVILSSLAFHPNGEFKLPNALPGKNGLRSVIAQPKGTVSFDDIINHETVHANPKGLNPMRHDVGDKKERERRIFAEEARADGQGVTGRGLYQRQGKVLTDADAASYHDFSHEHVHRAYNAVHDKVQDAFGTRNGEYRSSDPDRWAQARVAREAYQRTRRAQEETRRVAEAARRAKYMAGLRIGGGIAGGVGLAAGSKGLYDRYHRDHSGHFAPGANPNLRKH